MSALPAAGDDVPDFDLTDAQLRASQSVKWTYADADVLPAWVAEIDVRPAPVVRAALHDAVERGALGYPPEDGVSGLPEATAGFLARRFGWAVDPGRVVATGDVMASISLVITALCERAPVVVPVPSYPPFLAAVPLTGRPLVTVPCGGDGAGSAVLDVPAIERALAAGARTVLLANPHNPLGRAFTPAELGDLRDAARRHGVRVISDEIHAPLVLPGAVHTPFGSLPGTDGLVVTVTAASKAFNLAGLKCAQIVAGAAADADALSAVPHVSNHGVASLGVAASVAAFEGGDAWLDGLIGHLDARRRQFAELVAARLPGLSWRPMEATYLAWLDARPTGLADPALTALRRGRVMVNQGSTFGPGQGYDGHVRVNLATSAERLDRIVDRLATAWS